MAHQKSAPNQSQSECPEHSQLATERNRYFTGKYMTARDFRDEQRYTLTHHRWHQWTLHGWGIVWGLKVALMQSNPGEMCIQISPGMALDCHGRELVISHPIRFPACKLLPESPAGHSDDGQSGDYLLGLRFNTIDRDPVPVLLDDECRSGKNDHNRILEFAEVCWQPYCKKCWNYPRLESPATLPLVVPPQQTESSCGEAWTLEQHNHPDECCDHRGCSQEPVAFRADCTCGECGFVPLARIRQTGDRKGHWLTDDLGCRYVQSPFYGEALTHIVGVSWTHGKQTLLEKISELYESASKNDHGDQKYAKDILQGCHEKLGRIAIEFDRQLSEATSADLAQLLSLEYVLLDRNGGTNSPDLDGDDPSKPIIPRLVHLSKCRHWLFCDFPVHGIARHLPVRLRITLNCDMVLDDRGRAVDGDHLGGHVEPGKPGSENHNEPRPRSGNGIEGGMFFSWTTLTE